MSYSRFDVWAGLSFIATGGLAAAAIGLGTVVPHYQAEILGISACITGVAGLLVRIHGNPSPPVVAPDALTKEEPK